MDNQIALDALHNTLLASYIAGEAPSFQDSLKQTLEKLPPMQIGKHNQLQEWLEDVDNPKDEHRHISHLYGLYPSNQISPYSNPELFQAARNTLLQRGGEGHIMYKEVHKKFPDRDLAYLCKRYSTIFFQFGRAHV